MKRKCIAIAKKAMVWALAASMLVATPLTASAAGLRGVYKVEDGSGNTLHENGDNDTHTGTVSSTNTRSAALKSEAKIVGIALNETDIELVMDGAYNTAKKVTKNLEATILVDGDSGIKELDPDELDELNRGFTWSSTNKDVIAFENTQKDGRTNKMAVNAKAGGPARITVSLDGYYEGEEIHFKDYADVFVKQYAESIWFDTEKMDRDKDTEGIQQYFKHSLDLNTVIMRDPSTANDAITFDIDTAKSDKNIATIKNGVLTFKSKAGKVVVTAISEKGKQAEPVTINVSEGNPVTQIEIWEKGGTKKLSKTTLDVATKQQLEVVAHLWTGKKPKVEVTADNRTKCTDDIKWSAKKAGIVEIKENGDEATLVPIAAGSTQIIAQASSGRKATFNLTVTASLTDLEITPGETQLYSGQTFKFDIVKKSGDEKFNNFSNETVKWYIANKTAVKQYASINAKTGVLTIKPDVSEAVEKGLKIEVYAQATKSKKDGALIRSNVAKIDMIQSDISEITILDGDKPVATIERDKKQGEKVLQIIAADKSKTYRVVASGNVENAEKTLNWSSAKEKVAVAKKNDSGTGTISARTKGSANITVSGVTKNSRGKYVALKVVIPVKVMQPTKKLTLNKQSVVVKEDSKKALSVALTAKVDKGATSKITSWTVSGKDKDGNTIDLTGAGVTATKNTPKFTFKRAKGDYHAGDVYKITARADSGVTTTATINVVTASYGVVIPERDVDGNYSVDVKKNPVAYTKNTTTLAIGESLELRPMINISSDKDNPSWQEKTEENTKKYYLTDVTITANNKTAVSIIDGTVTRLKKGKVVITVKTADGKTCKLTVN